MKMTDLYPSNYLKADDLANRTVRATVAKLDLEEIGQDKTLKPILRFVGKDKGLVLNKTNAALIASVYGDDSDAWIGKPIELYPAQVSFQGKIVTAIRVSVPMAKKAQPPTPVVAAAGEDELNDDVDF